MACALCNPQKTKSVNCNSTFLEQFQELEILKFWSYQIEDDHWPSEILGSECSKVHFVAIVFAHSLWPG